MRCVLKTATQGAHLRTWRWIGYGAKRGGGPSWLLVDSAETMSRSEGCADFSVCRGKDVAFCLLL